MSGIHRSYGLHATFLEHGLQAGQVMLEEQWFHWTMALGQFLAVGGVVIPLAPCRLLPVTSSLHKHPMGLAHPPVK